MRLRRGAHLFPSLHHGPQLLHGLAGAQWTHDLGLLQLKTNGSYLWFHLGGLILLLIFHSLCNEDSEEHIHDWFFHIFPAKERCANLWRWKWTWMRCNLSFPETGELQTSTTGDSWGWTRFAPRAQGRWNLFGPQSGWDVWTKQLLLKIGKAVEGVARGYLILLVMPFFAHLSKQENQYAAGSRTWLSKRNSWEESLQKSRIILAVCLWILLSKNGWWNCFDLVRILFQHV